MPEIEAYLPAAHAALAAFGMASAQLKPISKTENAVFRVTDAAGAVFGAAPPPTRLCTPALRSIPNAC